MKTDLTIYMHMVIVYTIICTVKAMKYTPIYYNNNAMYVTLQTHFLASEANFSVYIPCSR